MKIVPGTGRDPLGRALELEAVGKDEIVSLSGEGPEGLILVGRCAGLDVADGETEGVVDLLKAGVGAGIPGGIGDRSGRDEADALTGGAVCFAHRQADTNATP